MAEQTRKPSRIWKIVLVVSLALNLAVAGVIAGSVLSGRSGEKGPRSFDLGVGPMARALAPRERREIARSLRDTRTIRELDPRARVAEMVAALQADPFDPAVLESLMDDQGAKMNEVQTQARKAFLDAIIAMTPERRIAFAQQVAEGLSRPRQQGARPSGG